ncbi:hypothetical protein Pla163_35430 [Planctomycetes bacterium Pla163]|uniref:Uncharacterized protein n=1 Tax=Rohdeia mirabilis TaxID=2528008 RepID=A0A518D4I6_9BACT|nr:hypothetical protein Pla163_35430 [Planctomycetes bacterium Pla163]
MVEFTGQSPTFAEVAREHVLNLRDLYVELLGAVGAPSSPAAVGEALGIDVQLAWRVRRFADAVDPLSVVAAIPTVGEAESIVDAALRRGVRARLLESLVDGTRAFDGFVLRNAESRDTFDAQITSLIGRDQSAVQLEARRAAFRANAVIKGRFCSSSVMVYGLAPGSREGLYSSFSVCGAVGLQRIRPEASLLLAHLHMEADEDDPGNGPQPLDPATSARFGAPLIGEFTSSRLAEAVEIEARASNLAVTLADSELGSIGAVTYMFGHRMLDFAWTNEHIWCELGANTPTKQLAIEFLVDERLPYGPADFRVVTDHDALRNWPDPLGPDSVVHCGRLHDLGRDLTQQDPSTWERLSELSRWSVDRMGWDPTHLRRYRLVVEHPLLCSIARVRCTRNR